MRLEFESVGQPMTSSAFGKWHWYFVMQHYGAPTRLLDWTLSPLVALYFAERDVAMSDAVVWVVDPWRWNRAHVKYLFGPAVAGWEETEPFLLDLEEAFNTDKNENQTKRKWPIPIEPAHIDRRIAAQGSRFMLFGTKKGMTRSPAVNRPHRVKGKHAVLDKIVVPNRLFADIRSELNSVGINERSMFPDFEGLGKHIAWEWKKRVLAQGQTKAAKRVRFIRTEESASRLSKSTKP